MIAPIIIENFGDLSFFPTKEAAEQYLEAEDVDNDQYRALDSDGRQLELSVVDKTVSTLFGLTKSRVRVVKLLDSDTKPSCEKELCELLGRYLLRLGEDKSSMAQLSLRDKLQLAIERAGFSN